MENTKRRYFFGVKLLKCPFEKKNLKIPPQNDIVLKKKKEEEEEERCDLPATPKPLFFFFGKLHPLSGLNHNLQFVQTRATSQTTELQLDGHRQASPRAAIFIAKHEKRQCIVTTQSKKESRQASGLVLQGCNIVSDPAFFLVRFEHRAYLGCP
jgi:hypothetical protein